MSVMFGSAYTLATQSPAGEMLPTRDPLTPYRAAQVLGQPGQPMGLFTDAEGYAVLVDGDEFQALQAQKQVRNAASKLDHYIRQAAKQNLNTLQTAVGMNAGFVDVSDIEAHPQLYPIGNAPAHAAQPPAQVVPLGEAAPTLPRPSVPAPAPSVASPFSGAFPTASDAAAVPPSSSPGATFNGYTTDQVAEMAKALATQLSSQLADKLGDNAEVSTKVSIRQVQDPTTAPPVTTPTASGASIPVVPLNNGHWPPSDTNGANPLAAQPLLSLNQPASPWAAMAPNPTASSSVAMTDGTVLPTASSSTLSPPFVTPSNTGAQQSAFSPFNVINTAALPSGQPGSVPAFSRVPVPPTTGA